MKKSTIKTHRISFQEKTAKGFVDRSFDAPKEHLEWQYGTSGAGCLASPADASRLGILPSPCYQGC